VGRKVMSLFLATKDLARVRSSCKKCVPYSRASYEVGVSPTSVFPDNFWLVWEVSGRMWAGCVRL
jgi:hypothetical protein